MFRRTLQNAPLSTVLFQGWPSGARHVPGVLGVLGCARLARWVQDSYVSLYGVASGIRLLIEHDWCSFLQRP